MRYSDEQLEAALEENPHLRVQNPSPRRSSGEQTPAQKALQAEARKVLENKFADLWTQLHGPHLENEYKFHPRRKWRADFYHPSTKTIIEIEGGIWMQGRHNRAQGYSDDCEKYNAATMRGYRVFRLTSEQLRADYIDRIIDFLRRL